MTKKGKCVTLAICQWILRVTPFFQLRCLLAVLTLQVCDAFKGMCIVTTAAAISRHAPRARRSYTKIAEVLETPNLIDVQLNSYRWFREEGLKELLNESSPIKDYSGTRFELHFLDHEFGKPTFQRKKIRERDLS